MAEMLGIGDKLHARYALDEALYPAVVTAVSASQRRKKAPVQVEFIGYEGREWKALTDLRSKKIPKTSTEPKGKAKAKLIVDYSALTKGTKLQAKADDGKWYAAQVVAISKAKQKQDAPVKINWVGYTSASDEWVGAGRLRSKLLTGKSTRLFFKKPSFSEPWPETDEERLAWVSAFLKSELPDLIASDVKKINAGFMGAAFILQVPGGAGGAARRVVFQRSVYPKHRAFVFHRAVASGGVAPRLMHTWYDPAASASMSIVEFVERGELMSYDVYAGGKVGEKPSVDMMEKCGRMLACIHRVNPSWHRSFASKEAAKAARVPEMPEGTPEIVKELFPLYDAADKTSLERFCAAIVTCAPEEVMEEEGIDRAYISAEIVRVLSHPVLPSAGWMARTVSMHGDFHGANIVVTGDGQPLAIDFEGGGVGPAGWDLGHLYLHVRSLEPHHDYERSYALCQGYLSAISDTVVPEKKDVEQLMFDMLAWQYMVGLKQWTCQIVTEVNGQKWAPEKRAEARRLLKRENLERYVANIQKARSDPELRAKLIRTGEVVP